MRTILFLTLALFSTQVFSAIEQITVGVKHVPPFTMISEDGKVSGYSIEYLDSIIEKGYPTGTVEVKYVGYDSVEELLRAVNNEKVDLAISALTITADREKYVNFSHPYFTTSPGIAVKPQGHSLWQSIADVGINLLLAIGVFIGLLYVIGKIMDKADGDLNIKNAHEGAWWAIVTFTTVGYGDFVPSTGRGRLVAATWMVASLFLVSIFTAHLSSIMTVEKMDNTPTQLSDLSSKKTHVTTIVGTTSQDLLLDMSLAHRAVDTLEEAVSNLKNKETDAIVHDAAVLNNLFQNTEFDVWAVEGMKEHYGIAFPHSERGDALRETFNIAILQLLDTRDIKLLNMKYF